MEESDRRNKTLIIIEPEKAKGKEILTSKWVFKMKDDGCYKVDACKEKET